MQTKATKDRLDEARQVFEQFAACLPHLFVAYRLLEAAEQALNAGANAEATAYYNQAKAEAEAASRFAGEGAKAFWELDSAKTSQDESAEIRQQRIADAQAAAAGLYQAIAEGHDIDLSAESLEAVRLANGAHSVAMTELAEHVIAAVRDSLRR